MGHGCGWDHVEKAGKHQCRRSWKIREVEEVSGEPREKRAIRSTVERDKFICFASYWWPWGSAKGQFMLWVGVKRLETMRAEGTGNRGRERETGSGGKNGVVGREIFYFKKFLHCEMWHAETQRTKYTTYYKVPPRLRNRILPFLSSEAPTGCILS